MDSATASWHCRKCFSKDARSKSCEKTKAVVNEEDEQGSEAAFRSGETSYAEGPDEAATSPTDCTLSASSLDKEND